MTDVRELRAEIDGVWGIYCKSDSAKEVDDAYEMWCRLVAELDALTRDRTTRRRTG